MRITSSSSLRITLSESQANLSAALGSDDGLLQLRVRPAATVTASTHIASSSNLAISSGAGSWPFERLREALDRAVGGHPDGFARVMKGVFDHRAVLLLA